MATELTVIPKVEVATPNSVAVASNLNEFEAELKALVAAAPADPQTDEDFVVLDSTAKTLKKAETALNKAEKALTESIPEIQAAFAQIEQIKGSARADRLTFERQVKTAKEARKEVLLADAHQELDAGLAKINANLEYPLPDVVPDFKSAAKGRRTLAGYKEALGIAVQQALKEAEAFVARCKVNEPILKQYMEDFPGIVPDAVALVYKPSHEMMSELQARAAEREHAEKRKAEAEKAAQEAEPAVEASPIEVPAVEGPVIDTGRRMRD